MTATARLYRRGKWTQDEDGHESVVDTWEIRTTSETDTITTVLSASGLPALLSSHPEKANALYNGDADCDHDPEVLTLWYANFRYSTKRKTREKKPFDEQRVKGGMQSARKEVPAYFDARGYPLVNSAGDIYEGLTRKRRIRKIPCTYNFSSIPNWFFDLADTINNADVTIHNKVYPAGTCMLTDINMPDEPELDNDTPQNAYWPVTYNIEIDPDGYYLTLPNKGAHELVYQTRANATAIFQDTTVALYNAKTPTTDRQIIKRRIQTNEQQDTAGSIWLNSYGQATLVRSFAPTQLGTGTITAGSTALTLATGSLILPPTAGLPENGHHTGALIRLQGAGPLGRWLTTRIETVLTTTTATLASPAKTTVTGKALWVSGAIVNYFVMDDLADWSAVPLPNNYPGSA